MDRHGIWLKWIPTISFLFIRLRIFRAIAHFSAHPPAPVYSFISTPGLCRLDIGNYLALRHEYACRSLYLHAALVLE